ncbi:hypothetical protein [Mycobacterium leprae]|nr:hypothetical protein [Mycobacterium leprae]
MSQQYAGVKNDLTVQHHRAIDEFFRFPTSYLIDFDIDPCIDVNTNLV